MIIQLEHIYAHLENLVNLGPNQLRGTLNDTLEAKNAITRVSRRSAQQFIDMWIATCRERWCDQDDASDIITDMQRDGYRLASYDAHTLCGLLGDQSFNFDNLLTEIRDRLSRQQDLFPREVQAYRHTARFTGELTFVIMPPIRQLS